MNLNRILYSMCYDMLEQKYIAHKTENGLAIACPQTPLWIWLAQGTTTADARLFFDGFLRQNPPPLTGIVAEKKFAIPCAEMYTQTKRREQHNTAAAFSQKELISYFLPPGVSLPSDAPLHGELRPPSPTEMPTILAWINAFYSETLQTSPPQKLKFEGEGGSGGEGTFQSSLSPRELNIIRLFVLHTTRAVAMGLLTGTGETCRINLVYVPPEFRGRGYGRVLVGALAKKIREDGQMPVLYTDVGNAAANGLYTALGFRAAGRLLEVGF